MNRIVIDLGWGVATINKNTTFGDTLTILTPSDIDRNTGTYIPNKSVEIHDFNRIKMLYDGLGEYLNGNK